ncbi:MAG: hypothetical protein AB1782_19980 [Cyanobacteriota bacterium]
MVNPFINPNKTAIILSHSSNASEKAYETRNSTTKTKKHESLFSLIDKEFNRQRELLVKETFELVA